MAKRKRKAVALDEDIKVGEGDETITIIDEIAKRLWECLPNLNGKKSNAASLHTQSFWTLFTGWKASENS
jgi:hypothetical protein